MVFLDIYDTIWNILDKEDILGDLIEETEDILGNFIKDAKYKVNNGYTALGLDFLLEYGLFHYVLEDGTLLIDYLYKNKEEWFNAEEKEILTFFLESKRQTLTFIEKKTRNENDTHGKEMFDIYFKNVNTGETCIIVSSTLLECLEMPITARTIVTPEKGENIYCVIGVIYSGKEGLEIFNAIVKYTEGLKNMSQAENNFNLLIEKSITLSYNEIEEYNEKSNYIEQDKKIMALNKKFYEQFQRSIPDFLNNVYELSNTPEQFDKQCAFYFILLPHLKDALENTNYMVFMDYFNSSNLLEGILALSKNDSIALNSVLEKLKKEGEKLFQQQKQDAFTTCRKNIIKKQKENINEAMLKAEEDKDSAKAERCRILLQKLEKCSSHEIKEVLHLVREFVENELQLEHDKDTQKDYEGIASALFVLESNAESLPFLKDIEMDYASITYGVDNFYEVFDVLDDDQYEVLLVLVAASYFEKRKYTDAYALIKNISLDVPSYAFQFTVGKILSYCKDKNYEKYFRRAKSINKERYKEDLAQFLSFKNTF